jgi:hypothetical protein
VFRLASTVRSVAWQGEPSVKKLQVAIIFALCALALYQWSTVRALQAQLADRGRVLRECRQFIPTRSELTAATRWLDEYYQSQEGLQRPQGLSIDGRPDFEGVTAWILDTYVWSRAEGASEQEARDRIVRAIRESDEWKTKHPSGAPK